MLSIGNIDNLLDSSPVGVAPMVGAADLKQEIDLYKELLANNDISMRVYNRCCKAATTKHLNSLAGRVFFEQVASSSPIQSVPKKRRLWCTVAGTDWVKASNWEAAKSLFLPQRFGDEHVFWKNDFPSNAWVKGKQINVRRYVTTDKPYRRRRILHIVKGILHVHVLVC